MEIQGLTPIDTLYEYTGYSISLQIGRYLIWSGYIVGFVLAVAILRLYYQGSREGTFKDLAIYPVYVLFIFFLVTPIPVSLTAPQPRNAPFLEETTSASASIAQPSTLEVPRILAYVGAVMGSLQTNMVSDICDDMHSAMYQWKHIASINSNTRIFNANLRDDLGVYLKCCYTPAMAQFQTQAQDPWQTVPLAGLGIDSWLSGIYVQQNFQAEETHLFSNETSSCASLQDALSSAVGSEISSSTYHQNALAAYNRLAKTSVTGGDAPAYISFYRRRLLYNQMFILGTASASTIRQALPEYNLFKGGLLDLKYVTSETADHSLWASAKLAVTALPRALAAISSTLAEGWAQDAMGPATYYRVSALGPYVYGLLLAFLVMCFPIAGLLAFWPQGWTAIVNFMKLFVSVKLWPIFWAYLSGMLSYREVFNANDPEGFQGTFGSDGMFPALALMYLVVPVFSFMIASIAQHAGGAILGSLLAHGETASLGGTFGAVTGVARGVDKVLPKSSE